MDFSTKYLQLNAKSVGKDKIYRLLQYGCKLIWYILWKYKSNKEYIDILKRIESSMSSTRKVMRLAGSYDAIQNALKTIHIDNDFLRIILTGSNINNACYLFLDNLSWLNSTGAIQFKQVAKLNEWSNKFWLFSSILSITRDIYEITNKIDEIKRHKNSKTKRTQVSKSMLMALLSYCKLIFIRNPNLMIDTIKNTCDVFLPLSNLGFIKISPGVQGALGLISSLFILLTIWEPKYKLTP
jgi:hypothetical protein